MRTENGDKFDQKFIAVLVPELPFLPILVYVALKLSSAWRILYFYDDKALLC